MTTPSIPGYRQLSKVILLLAWPTVVEQLLQTVVQYADSAMVGRLGADASAAVGITTSAVWLISNLFLAGGIGALAVIARAVGAKEMERAGKASVQTVYVALALGILVGFLALAVSDVLPGWMGAEPAVQEEASRYFFIISLPMLFRSAMILFSAVLRASGDTRTPMVVNLLINGLNILLNFFLIYQTRPITLLGRSFSIWGAGMGVTGAAIATATAITAGGILMTLALFKSKRGVSPLGHGYRLDKAILTDVWRVGLPNAGERTVVCLGHMVFAALVAGLGTTSLAAHSIAITAEQAFYIPGYGFQAAATTLAGQTLGEGDEEKLNRLIPVLIFFAVGLMTLGSLFLFCFPNWIMSLFTPDLSVIQQGATVLRIVSLSEPFFALQLILEGVFHGVGDTKASFLYALFSMWGIRIFFTFLCTQFLSLGLTAVWCCMVADIIARTGMMFFRYRTGRWKQSLVFSCAHKS